MKWFDKWFAKKCKESLAYPSVTPIQDIQKYSFSSAHRPQSNGLQTTGTTFVLYNANGGTVVELTNYNLMNEVPSHILYVIPKEADLGQQLAHIVTIEALKR